MTILLSFFFVIQAIKTYKTCSFPETEYVAEFFQNLCIFIEECWSFFFQQHGIHVQFTIMEDFLNKIFWVYLNNTINFRIFYYIYISI